MLSRSLYCLSALSVVALGAAGLLAGSAAATRAAPATEVRIAFAGDPRTSPLPVVADRYALVTGSVIHAGRGVSGVTLEATVSIPGHGSQVVGTVTTSHTGRFAARIQVVAREKVTFFGALFPTGRLVSNSLRFRPVVAVSLRLSRHDVPPGGTVTFRGRATPAPPVGSIVLLQVRQGHGYRVFRVVRTNRRGRFHGDYEFAQGPAAYLVRAEVPDQGGFGYTNSMSNLKRIAVRGS